MSDPMHILQLRGKGVLCRTAVPDRYMTSYSRFYARTQHTKLIKLFTSHATLSLRWWYHLRCLIVRLLQSAWIWLLRYLPSQGICFALDCQDSLVIPCQLVISNEQGQIFVIFTRSTKRTHLKEHRSPRLKPNMIKSIHQLLVKFSVVGPKRSFLINRYPVTSMSHFANFKQNDKSQYNKIFLGFNYPIGWSSFTFTSHQPSLKD